MMLPFTKHARMMLPFPKHTPAPYSGRIESASGALTLVRPKTASTSASTPSSPPLHPHLGGPTNPSSSFAVLASPGKPSDPTVSRPLPTSASPPTLPPHPTSAPPYYIDDGDGMSEPMPSSHEKNKHSLASVLNPLPPPLPPEPYAASSSPAVPPDQDRPVESPFGRLPEVALEATEARELFQFYFERLNPLVALLDPVLHSFSRLHRRPHSDLLLLALLAVSSKFTRLDLYPRLLASARQGVEHAMGTDATSCLETVQALLLLCFWREPDDSSAWRKIGFAIRVAYELDLHNPIRRPLPPNIDDAREIINRERVWLQLACFDHALSTQRGKPSMISEEDIPSGTVWHRSLGDLAHPFDAMVAVSSEIAFLCKRFSMSIGMAQGGRPHVSPSVEVSAIDRTINTLKRYVADWTAEAGPLGDVEGPYAPMLRLACSSFCLQQHDRRLALASSADGMQGCLPLDREQELAICASYAFEVLDIFTSQVAGGDHLRFAQDLVAASAASAALWLRHHWQDMDDEAIAHAVRSLEQAVDVCVAASQTDRDCPAYLSGFLRYCLAGMRTLTDDPSAVGETGKGKGKEASPVGPMNSSMSSPSAPLAHQPPTSSWQRTRGHSSSSLLLRPYHGSSHHHLPPLRSPWDGQWSSTSAGPTFPHTHGQGRPYSFSAVNGLFLPPGSDPATSPPGWLASPPDPAFGRRPSTPLNASPFFFSAAQQAHGDLDTCSSRDPSHRPSIPPPPPLRQASLYASSSEPTTIEAAEEPLGGRSVSGALWPALDKDATAYWKSVLPPSFFNPVMDG